MSSSFSFSVKLEISLSMLLNSTSLDCQIAKKNANPSISRVMESSSLFICSRIPASLFFEGLDYSIKIKYSLTLDFWSSVSDFVLSPSVASISKSSALRDLALFCCSRFTSSSSKRANLLIQHRVPHLLLHLRHQLHRHYRMPSSFFPTLSQDFLHHFLHFGLDRLQNRLHRYLERVTQ